jgi:hypothetical protein
MKRVRAIPITLLALVLASSAGVWNARAQNDSGLTSSGQLDQKLQLTAAQRNAIYAAVSNDKSKTAPERFPTVVGGDVPPSIELYALPDDAVAGNAAAKLFKYTMVQDEVVLVDPTKMRVIDVIGPAQQR